MRTRDENSSTTFRVIRRQTKPTKTYRLDINLLLDGGKYGTYAVVADI